VFLRTQHGFTYIGDDANGSVVTQEVPANTGVNYYEYTNSNGDVIRSTSPIQTDLYEGPVIEPIPPHGTFDYQTLLRQQMEVNNLYNQIQDNALLMGGMNIISSPAVPEDQAILTVTDVDQGSRTITFNSLNAAVRRATEDSVVYGTGAVHSTLAPNGNWTFEAVNTALGDHLTPIEDGQPWPFDPVESEDE
jgi:hypothetical protein